jgi:hypothetical protein
MKQSTLGLGAAIFLSAYGSAFAQSDGEFVSAGIQITLPEIELARLEDANATMGSYGELFVLAQAKQKKTSRKKGHNYNSGPNSSLGFIPGYVPTPYGRGDCIGRWVPLGNGLMRCQGQFIPYRY